MMSADSGEAVLQTSNDGPKIPDAKKTKFDVIIIGAGPSGYTAGIYCSRAGYDTLILSGLLPGGQLVNTTEVENYPGFENGDNGPRFNDRNEETVSKNGNNYCGRCSSGYGF